MMKVLQVIDSLEVGGAERVFLDITKLLLDNEIQVDILIISKKGSLYNSIDGRSKIHLLNRKNKYNLFKFWECATICEKYDIIHVHMRHTYSYVRLAQLISGKKFKIIFHDHFGDIEFDRSVPITMKFFFKPEFYIGVSKSLVDWAVEKVSIPAQNVKLLRNTIIPANIHLEEDFYLSMQNWVIVSNIRQTKNIEFAIQLAKTYNKNLTIYGNTYNDQYSLKILELIKSSTGISLIQNEKSIQNVLKNYSLALHTAYSETGPLVLMEYMAQGLPFLAHNTGEVAFVIRNELPQCFVDNLDEQLWLKAIEELVRKPPCSQLLKKLFYTYFGPEQYIKQCLEIYKKVIGY